MEAEWVTIRDASRMLGVSERSVRRYIKRYDWDSKLDTLSGSSVNQRFVRKSDVVNHMDDTGGGQAPAGAGGGTSSDGIPLPPAQVREGMDRVADAFEKMAGATEGQAERMEEMLELQRRREDRLASAVEQVLETVEERSRHGDEPEEQDPAGGWSHLGSGLMWGVGFALGVLVFYAIVLAIVLAAG